MDQVLNMVLIVMGVVLTQNIVLAQFLGLCSFVGVSKNLSSAFGMGMAVTFVMVMASLVAWLLTWFVLYPLQLDKVLTIILYILVIASLVQLVEMVIAKVAPALYKVLGIYLPLITTNCAVLAIALFNKKDFIPSDCSSPMVSLTASLVNGFGGGLSYTLAICLMAGIRERLEFTNTPAPLRGIPGAFICASLMALSFQGFINLIPAVKLF